MIPATEVTLATLVAEKTKILPGFKVLTFVSLAANGDYEEETRTYAELHHNGRALASALLALGIGAGEQIAVMMNNHPEFVEAMLATTTLGAAFVPVDPRSLGAKLTYMLDFTECRGVICADYCADNILAVADECPRLQWLIVVPTGAELPQLNATRLTVKRFPELMTEPVRALPATAPDMDDPMFMMFTSGTTGNPKAVVQSHRKYMALATSYSRFDLKPGEKLYSGLSLTHINAQNALRNALALSVPGVFSRKFTKSRIWDICRHYGCAVLGLLGGMIPELYAVPEKPDDVDNPVRFVFTAGMPAAIWKDFERRFGVTVLESYGATEGGGMTNPPGVGPVGSIGKPSPEWEAAILDADGRRLGPDQAGEICFRRKDGAPVVVEYFKNPEASGDKVRGGWLHMGDIGHHDENGWFFFHHRDGGGVRRNGDFVNTSLVESVISKAPRVADVFVYGVATEKNVSGEKTLVAAVVPTADIATFKVGELLAYCRGHLEKNDVPEIVQVLVEIPKTISEKPIEKACIDLLRQAELV